ncbi:MAG: BTAD domain-containing putative transcriptional regulator, partial [Candidatus Promineifilaceae bacterium]|nr:BTAD domain-containing putative transcriptional regulator [Candidatus Promineifilaceae bacterium]
MVIDKLRIETLGGLSIERGGEALEDFASSKVEALLVYLACTGREHPREALAELLWDGRSQRRSLANLRVVLSSLRKEVGPFVSISRSTAAIDDEADVWLDAAQLEEAVKVLQEAEAPDTAEAVEEALALYEGDFLAGFFVPEASGFEEWAAGERQRLHRLTVDGLQRLGRRHLRQAEYTAAVASATRLVQLDPLAEAGHRQLMEALSRNGQRAEALAQYETCREILAEELAIEPEAETRALHEAIRENRLPSEQSRTVASQVVTPILPDFLTTAGRETDADIPFFGRQEALARLEEHLQEALAGKGRAIFVSGEAGVGKSALVREFARRATEEDGKLIVALGHCSTLAAGEGVYQPVRQILNQLCGDVEAAVTAGDLGPEQARRLWQLMPCTAQAILKQGPNLPGVFFNGASLVARLRSALPKRTAWLDRL